MNPLCVVLKIKGYQNIRNLAHTNMSFSFLLLLESYCILVVMDLHLVRATVDPETILGNTGCEMGIHPE